ncbi:MAG: histidine kinase [Aquaticitalea sp.]
MNQEDALKIVQPKNDLRFDSKNQNLKNYFRLGLASIMMSSYSNIGNTYRKLKNYEKAEEFTLKSLAVLGFEESNEMMLVNLGKIYLGTIRYKKAKKILDSAMQNTLSYGTRKYQLEAFHRFHELDVKTSNYKMALKNYIDYKNIKDSLINETKIKQIAEISEHYKTADKERKILLQRAELAEKKLIVQEQNLQVLGLLSLGMVMTMVGFLLHNQQKLKNKQLHKEKELKEALIKIEQQNKLQEQRLRISHDLHDKIGAQLTFIISSIDNLKDGFDIKDEKLTKKLNGISEFTSSTIYELRDTIWAMNKNEITFEDLQIRISNYIDKAHVFDDKISFSFNVSNDVDLTRKFSSVEGMNIHRVIQEAIHNSLKHANPRKIQVQISQQLHNLLIVVSHDGDGLVTKSGVKGHWLINMQKRVTEIGGELRIESEASKGTKIKILL